MITFDKIYCIGDSHVKMFEEKNFPFKYKRFAKYFNVHFIGAPLAYNLVEKNTTSGGREKLFNCLKNIPAKSKIMLCFGEIDCRVHLIRQIILQRRHIDDVVKECVERYFSVINEISNLGFDIIIFNVIPSTKFLDVKKEKRDFFNFIYGSCKKRNQVSKIFNTEVAKLCEKFNYIFIDVFDYFVYCQLLYVKR